MHLDKLNKYMRVYGACKRFILYIHHCSVTLQLIMANINTHCLLIHREGLLEDFLGKKMFSKKLIEDSEGQSDLTHKQRKNRADYFEWLEHKKSYIPSLEIEPMFLSAFISYKDLKKALHMIDYQEEKHSIQFLDNEVDHETMEDARKALKDFENSEDLLLVLDLYKKYIKYSLMKTECIRNKDFLEMILNFNKAIKLTEKEKEEAENDMIEAAG